MSEKIWSDDAWEDYLYWQQQDKKTLKHIISKMVESILRIAEVITEISNRYI